MEIRGIRFVSIVLSLIVVAACSSGSGGAGPGTGGTGGTGGAGGAPDGGGAGGSVPGSFAAELEKLEKGEPADLDGDGYAEAILQKNDDGSSTYESDRDGDGVPEYVLTDDGKGHTIAWVDADGDGFAEQLIEEVTTETKQRQVTTVDQDRNGFMDHRYTWEVDRDTLDVATYTEEEDADETGEFTIVETKTVPSTRNAGSGGCDGMDNFPSGGDAVELPGGTTLRTGPSPGACDGGDADQVREAYECAVERGRGCLSQTNTKEFQNLATALAGKRVRPLQIGCGNACGGVVASTKSWNRPWFLDSKLNINVDEFSKLDDDGRCNIMLHELLHWAGNNGSADHNEGEGAGDDDVYSCGRYCGGCSHAGHGSPNNSAIDCARCADTAERKAECGVKIEYAEASCGGSLRGICHAGLGCVAGDCQECGGIFKSYCDGTVFETAATCCNKCPQGCDGSNDMPCSGKPDESDGCTDQSPPFCG